ncbi:MAG: hypothetical protein RBU29_00480 [bacterium]|jgi:hypothetical protein|nr:hypothetical protein [bacterium]
MKRKTSILSILLLLVFAAVFFWAQYKIVKAREGVRMEEKILMLSDRPAVTKTLAMGFDAALADLFWIRSIQFFGGNFSSLSKPEKRDGLLNLMENMVYLDPHFVSAWKFGGFVINESIKEPNTAIDFLLRGARNNPEEWRLTFDAGFISFYDLQDFALAKQLFIQSIYGESFAPSLTPSVEGSIVEGSEDMVHDGDPDSQLLLAAEGGSLALSYDRPFVVGRIAMAHNTGANQSMRIQVADSANPGVFNPIEQVTSSQYIFTVPPQPVTTDAIVFDQFHTTDESGHFAIAEVEVFGASNPQAPAYAERMAIEMDSKSGRFLASWEQNVRYYYEAITRGDEISASVVAEKLTATYSQKCFEILEEAVKLYQEEKGELPSTHLFELIRDGYLERVLNRHVDEDPDFLKQVIPVLMPNGKLMELLTSWNPQEPYAHVLIVETDSEGKEDWYITSEYNLLKERQMKINEIQRLVDTYKKQKNQWPETLEAMVNEPWFSQSPDLLFKDPLNGQFYVDPATGKVQVRDATP